MLSRLGQNPVKSFLGLQPSEAILSDSLSFLTGKYYVLVLLIDYLLSSYLQFTPKILKLCIIVWMHYVISEVKLLRYQQGMIGR